MIASRGMDRWVREALTVAVLWTLLSMLLMAAPVSAQGFGSFTLTGRADVAAIQTFTSALPASGASTSVGPGSPVFASAVLDSLGNSKAQSAAPYPGPTVTGLPSDVAGLGLPFLPSYPFFVQSDHPTNPEDEVSNGGITLSARSSENESVARTTVGLASDANQAGAGVSEVRVSQDPANLAASASASASGVAVGEMLQLGTMRSRAFIEVPSDGEPVVETEFQVDGLTIDGQGVSIGPEGLVLAGQPVPIPADELLGGLRDAGFDVTLLEPEVIEEDGSITAVSGGLKVDRQDVLADGTSVRTVTTFGRAAVTVASQTVGAIAPPSTPTEDPTVPAPDAATADTAPTVDSSAPTPSTTSTGVRTPSPPDPSAENPVVAPPSSGTAAPPAPATDPEPRVVALASGPDTFDANTLYLMLVVSALAAITASRLLGWLAVRSRSAPPA